MPLVHIAVALQQWLHELPPVLRYTCIACLDKYSDWEFRYKNTTIPSLTLHTSVVRIFTSALQKLEASLHQNAYGYCLQTR